MATFQPVETTVTCDANGYFFYTFGSHIDMVMVSVGGPQTGGDLALIGASAIVTGDKSCGVKVWHSSSTPSYGCKPAANQQVTVTLLGIAS